MYVVSSRPKLSSFTVSMLSTSRSVATGSKDFLLELTGLFRQEECLWKVKSEDYCIRSKKDASYLSQMKHQLDATLCRFYFCRVTLHVSGGKRPSSGVFKTSTAAIGTCFIVAGKSSHLLIRAERLTKIIRSGITFVSRNVIYRMFQQKIV